MSEKQRIHNILSNQENKYSLNTQDNEHNNKVNRTTKHLEDLLKIRELKKAKLNNIIKQKNNYGFAEPVSANQQSVLAERDRSLHEIEEEIENTLDPFIYNLYNDDSVSLKYNPYNVSINNYASDKYHKHYSHHSVWDAYWPFVGSGDSNPRLD